MSFSRASAVIGAAAVSLVLMSPAAVAAPIVDHSTAGGAMITAAPPGERCGAYTLFDGYQTNLWYKHCGDSRVRVEVDMVYSDNYTTCFAPWENARIRPASEADNAWYVRPC